MSQSNWETVHSCCIEKEKATLQNYDFFFFYFQSGFNEPTGKSEETVEMKHLRKSSVTEAKNALMQEKE